MYGGASAPQGWLLCDGAAMSRTTYARLFGIIGTTFGVGDGSTTFNVPDMRESVPAGAGTFAAVTGSTHTAALHVAADARTLGDFKNDQVQGHKTRLLGGTGSGGALQRIAYGGSYSGSTNLDSAGDIPISDGTNGTPRTGLVTRPKSVGLNFIIKT
jgi:phage-related tail fiber protein